MSKPASKPQPRVERRDFMAGGAAVVGASLCSGCSIFTSQVRPDMKQQPQDGALILSDSLRSKLKKPGSVVRVVSKDGKHRVIVVRQANGKLAAVSMVCTHWGSDIYFVEKSGQFKCPTHGSRFDVSGKVVGGPAEEALEQHAVEETDTRIRIVLEPRG